MIKDFKWQQSKEKRVKKLLWVLQTQKWRNLLQLWEKQTLPMVHISSRVVLDNQVSYDQKVIIADMRGDTRHKFLIR